MKNRVALLPHQLEAISASTLHVEVDELQTVVIGLGLIGGSLFQTHPRSHGYDNNQQVATFASVDGRVIAASVKEAVADADIIVIATPPAACAPTIIEVLRANGHATVIDVCSVKTDIIQSVLAQAREHASRYVPAHPLAGAASSGWAAAKADLLVDAPWVVCPHSELAPLPLWTAIKFITSVQGSVIGCESEVHDRALAHASHVVQLQASTLATYTPPSLAMFVNLMHGGGMRDGTRVAASDPTLWREIITRNQIPVIEALDDLIGDLTGLREAIAAADYEAVERVVARGRERKAEMEAARWQLGRWHEETWALDTLIPQLLLTGARSQMIRSRSRVSTGLPVHIRSI